MATGDISISTKFFGLNKQDVKEYFQNLEKEQKKIIDELLRDKKMLEREKEKLLTELEESKKEQIKYEDEIVKKSSTKDEVVLDAHKRVEKTTSLINILAEEEAEQLMKKANEQLVDYDKIIDELQETIDENKVQIESLLNDVLKILKSNAGNVLKKDVPLKDKIAEEQALPNIKELEIFKEKLKENKFSLEKNNKERITADGTSLNVINNLLMFRKKYASDEENEEDLIVPKEKTTKEDLYKIINGYDIDDEFNNDLLKTDFFHFDEEESLNPLKQSLSLDGGNEPLDNQNEQSDEDINKMRNSLIIGKIAGEDVIDNNNNVIIQKGKILDDEDIMIAEREGKLPELIINMVLPSNT